MRKRVLLVGSSFSAAPFFFCLKRRGFHVSVCGALQNDPCHAYADASVFVDYSDREKLLEVVESQGFDYLVPVCNDYSYLSSAWVAEKIGYPGFDDFSVAEQLHTKAAFRQVLAARSLPCPEATELGEVFDGLERIPAFPVLVKPVDSFSGRGISRVDEPAALAAAVKRARLASRSARVLVESYVDGQLCSHSAFIRGARIAVDFFVDEYCTVYPYQVNCSNHPSAISVKWREVVRSAIEDIAGYLGLSDGLIHTQFMVNDSGVFIIECMRRCPGDLYGHLVELSTGVPYHDLYLRKFIGEALPDNIGYSISRPFGRHTVSSKTPGVMTSFRVRGDALNSEIFALKGSGEPIGEAPFDKAAIIFSEFASEQLMLDQVPEFAERIELGFYDTAPACSATRGDR